MAVWNVGPYDNDDAVDWCADLESALPGEREPLVRSTLEEVVQAGTALTDEAASRAVAAAATVLQAATGKPASNSPYAPHLPPADDDILATPALSTLAVEALDIVVRDGSPWRSRWADDVEEEDVLEVIAALRVRLTSLSSPPE